MSAVPAGLPRRERNKQEKRAALLAAARALFARRGFAETTTAQIARRAGVGAGTLFLYFASKHDLLVAIFREEMDATVDRAFATLPPRVSLLTELVHVYGATLALHARDPVLARAFVKEMMFVSAPNRDAVFGFIDGLQARIVERITRRQASGELDAEVSAGLAAQNLFALYIARLQKWLAFDAVLPSDEVRAQLRDAFALQLRALAPLGVPGTRRAAQRARRT